MLRLFNTGYAVLFILLASLSVAIAAESAFTGSESCSSCHAEQQRSWKGSDHDLAMQHTRKDTVLGDFNNTEFSANGITSRFFKNDGRFWVNTDGPDGNMQDFEIKYTFGVTPLQQYLIEFPGGRIQTLGIAWDTRPANDGGQRWFHLYPDQTINAGDDLHWTGAQQNWNYESKMYLNNLIKVIRNRDCQVIVGGYTSEDFIPTDDYPTSWQLSAEFATAVTRYFNDVGKIDYTRLAAIGYGKYQPLLGEESSLKTKANNRINIIISDL